MSTDSGIAAIAGAVVEQAKENLLEQRAADQRQLDLLDPPTPEEMLSARLDLGQSANNLEVLERARTRRAGRPAGARNKRTDDFARYILSFGQDPAITLMQISSTPAEVLMENSRRLKQSRRTKDGRQIDVTQTMSYEAALSLKKQCAAELMPFIHAKKPIAVDLSFAGIADLMIEGVTHTRDELTDIIEGDFLSIDEQLAPQECDAP